MRLIFDRGETKGGKIWQSSWKDSNNVKGAEELGRVLFLLDAVARGLWLTTSAADVLVRPHRDRTPIVVLKVIHVGPENIDVQVGLFVILMLAFERRGHLLLRFNWRIDGLPHALELVGDERAIFRPNAVERSNAWLLLVEDDGTAVALDNLELANGHFVVFGDGDQVRE